MSSLVRCTMNFESTNELEARKAEKRKARENILDEAKAKYDIEERKIAAARAKGEGTWMLPELSKQLDKQSKKLKKKTKKVKKEKKAKHEKKSKKSKEKHSNCSGSDESDQDMWVEKTKNGKEVSRDRPVQEAELVTTSSEAVIKGPKLQRDDWMALDSSDIPTISRLELREKIKQDKLQYGEQKKEESLNIEEPGTHSKELNPYWKSGAGTGLPEQEKPAITVPKHNVAFLNKAYARCEKEAEDTGESLDSIVAERYGSMEQLETMIMDAERAEELAKETAEKATANKSKSIGNRNRRHSRSRSPLSKTGRRGEELHRRPRSRSDSRSRRRSRSDDRRRRINISNERLRRRSRSKERSKRRSVSGGRDRRRSRSNNRNSNMNRPDGSSKRRSRTRSNDRHRRPSNRSRDRDCDRNRNRSRDSDRSKRPRHRSSSSGSDSSNNNSNSSSDDRTGSKSDRCRDRSGSREQRSRRSHSRSPRRLPAKRRFIKPGESDQPVSTDKPKRSFLKPGEHTASNQRSTSNSTSSTPSWKKPGYSVKAKDTKDKSTTNMAARDIKVDKPASSGSDSSSDTEESESEASEPEQPVVVALTDDEMNALGAKILKAELMGNDEMAKELKQKIEMARQARASGVKPASSVSVKEKVVILSHADKYGNVRPVQSQDPDLVKGRKRRAKKTETHNKSGERERYFADDDHFNIKDMVQAEKMTSAEDQHLMFSKMASKVTEKIDDDNQIDDVMINRARLQHDPSKEAAKQQQQAYADSKKLAQTLDNCQYCLENMTKHLIVAVYKNTYLCLPEHQSLSEGHCRIVPIHHCISSTVCDEDIWNEVQEFRRALVKMFAATDDQDCVFMECSKNLKRHPHMMVECVPIERELGDMAPIYFKKAIDESEKEWAQNKKLIDLSKKDIRHSIPKGFPYFAVDFGLQGGFAHVIEDEHSFPASFGKEVIGGMMDVDPRLWRKPRKEIFEDQRKKVVKFAKIWKPYDFTFKAKDSDSD